MIINHLRWKVMFSTGTWAGCDAACCTCAWANWWTTLQTIQPRVKLTHSLTQSTILAIWVICGVEKLPGVLPQPLAAFGDGWCTLNFAPLRTALKTKPKLLRSKLPQGFSTNTQTITTTSKASRRTLSGLSQRLFLAIQLSWRNSKKRSSEDQKGDPMAQLVWRWSC